MQMITTIGLDIAKSVFQVHGVDAAGEVVIRRQLKRRYVLAFFQKLSPCLVGIEACASSHYWSRELQALGHTVRLMPPAYVKPYVKRQKNDMADAEAICEAVTRANMRFVPTKTSEQQSCLMLHRTRHLFIRQQTAVINSIRAHLAEFGIVAPVGRKGVMELLDIVADPSDKRVPEVARACLAALGTQLLRLKEQILEFDRMIMAWHRSNQTSKRLHYIHARRRRGSCADASGNMAMAKWQWHGMAIRSKVALVISAGGNFGRAPDNRRPRGYLGGVRSGYPWRSPKTLAVSGGVSLRCQGRSFGVACIFCARARELNVFLTHPAATVPLRAIAPPMASEPGDHLLPWVKRSSLVKMSNVATVENATPKPRRWHEPSA